MPKAVLIGFKYSVDTLYSSVKDLENAYIWCKTYQYQIKIFSDLSSICDIETTYVRTGDSLIEHVCEYLKQGIVDKKLMIYYTGHGIKQSMVMPDKLLLSFAKFRDSVLSVINSDIEIFWILDCCNPNGLYLPFKLGKRGFDLSKLEFKCVPNPILLITSSEETEKSIATKNESLFTKYLFPLLSSLNDNRIKEINGKIISLPHNRNIKRIIDNLNNSIQKSYSGYNQTVSVYSSYQIDPIMWFWIGSNKNYEIITDLTLSTISVRQIIKTDNM